MEDNDAILLAILMIAITIIIISGIAVEYDYELKVKDNHLIQTGRIYKNCIDECDSAIPDNNQAETLECLKSCSSKAKCIIEEI